MPSNLPQNSARLTFGKTKRRLTVRIHDRPLEIRRTASSSQRQILQCPEGDRHIRRRLWQSPRHLDCVRRWKISTTSYCWLTCLRTFGLFVCEITDFIPPISTPPRHIFTSLLKMTGAKLDLFTDPEKHLFIENNIRGGVSMIGNWYTKANNKCRDDELDSTLPTSFVSYLDANNLCGYAMSQPLPTGNFRFLTEDEIEHIDILNVPDDIPRGTS